MIAKSAQQKLEQEARIITLELYNMNIRRKAFKKRLQDIQQQVSILSTVIKEEDKEAASS